MRSIPIKTAWRAFRANYWLALTADVVAILLVFFAIHSWQMRNLLPADEEGLAPDFQLVSLAGEDWHLSELQGQRTVVFFFAPWCGVCNASISNLEALHQTYSKDGLNVLAVGMDYEAISDLVNFRDRHKLTVPVLLGDPAMLEAWQVPGYPTYYVVDETGRIIERSLGYATGLGLRWRST